MQRWRFIPFVTLALALLALPARLPAQEAVKKRLHGTRTARGRTRTARGRTRTARGRTRTARGRTRSTREHSAGGEGVSLLRVYERPFLSHRWRRSRSWLSWPLRSRG